MKVSVAFLDRDGVINEQAPPHQYITKWADFRYLPNVFEGLQLLKNAGYKIYIVSNQRCISRGIATREEIEELNRQLISDLERHQCKIDGIYYCPHGEEDHCNCRKPRTGMLEKAENELKDLGYGIDKQHSWMIGDFHSDIQTGINYGINTVKIKSQGVDTSAEIDYLADGLLHLEAESLAEAAELIVKRDDTGKEKSKS